MDGRMNRTTIQAVWGIYGLPLSVSGAMIISTCCYYNRFWIHTRNYEVSSGRVKVPRRSIQLHAKFLLKEMKRNSHIR